jgi:hypothetical protein
MSNLKQNLQNPATSNIIADSLANLALISMTLAQLGFESHLKHATALTEALADELEIVANDVLTGHSEPLEDLLDELDGLYGDSKIG